MARVKNYHRLTWTDTAHPALRAIVLPDLRMAGSTEDGVIYCPHCREKTTSKLETQHLNSVECMPKQVSSVEVFAPAWRMLFDADKLEGTLPVATPRPYRLLPRLTQFNIRSRQRRYNAPPTVINNYDLTFVPALRVSSTLPDELKNAFKRTGNNYNSAPTGYVNSEHRRFHGAILLSMLEGQIDLALGQSQMPALSDPTPIGVGFDRMYLRREKCKIHEFTLALGWNDMLAPLPQDREKMTAHINTEIGLEVQFERENRNNHDSRSWTPLVITPSSLHRAMVLHEKTTDRDLLRVALEIGQMVAKIATKYEREAPMSAETKTSLNNQIRDWSPRYKNKLQETQLNLYREIRPIIPFGFAATCDKHIENMIQREPTHNVADLVKRFIDGI